MFVPVHPSRFSPITPTSLPLPTSTINRMSCFGLPRALATPNAQQPARCQTVKNSPEMADFCSVVFRPAWNQGVPRARVTHPSILFGPSFFPPYHIGHFRLSDGIRDLWTLVLCPPFMLSCSLDETLQNTTPTPALAPFDFQFSGVDHPALAAWLLRFLAIKKSLAVTAPGRRVCLPSRDTSSPTIA